jgi:hypothetical protein
MQDFEQKVAKEAKLRATQNSSVDNNGSDSHEDRMNPRLQRNAGKIVNFATFASFCLKSVFASPCGLGVQDSIWATRPLDLTLTLSPPFRKLLRYLCCLL